MAKNEKLMNGSLGFNECVPVCTFATYIDLLPLRDVADEPREPQQTHQRQQFGKPENP